MLFSLSHLADVSAATSVMRSVITPTIDTLSILASLVCVIFIISSGIQYITSSGKPEKLQRAKKIMRDAVIGLLFVLGAVVLTSILSHAYGSPSSEPIQHIPNLSAIKPSSSSLGLVGVLVDAITGLLQNVVTSIGKPFIDALSYFTQSTPLMAENSSVFNLWLVTTAIADVLFVLIIALLGFHVMSASTLGFEELDINHLLPQLILAFLLINSSIFVIDTIISLSNGMISALRAGFGDTSVWATLSKLVSQSSGIGLAALLILIVFLVFAFILLVYYVGRLVTLYLGASLAPVVILLWLLPSFKDFASSAIKTYLSTIFVLFVHVVILTLAATIFASLTNNSAQPDPIMSLLVGMSTLISLIKTQGVLLQLNYASIGPKSLRRLGHQFMNGISSRQFGYRAS